MGCSCGTQARPATSNPKLTRRLSLGEVDGTGIVDCDVDRGTLMQLEEANLLEAITAAASKQDGEGASPGLQRRMSFTIGSETDSDMHRRQSYGGKDVRTTVGGGGDQDTLDPAAFGIGFACKKGLKPVSPNQDSFVILKVDNVVSLYGVFDGHGRSGHDVSDFVKKNLAKLFVQEESFMTDPPAALRNAFYKTQLILEQETRDTKEGTLDASVSGTTCTILVHYHKTDTVYLAHVGDSRCVVAIGGDDGGLKAVDLSIDHKPELPDEKKRIHANGGQVRKNPYDVPHRVYVKGERYPGLAMSRALGDLVGYLHAGISAEPTVTCRPVRRGKDNDVVTPGEPAGRDQFILVCSDGVWEFLSSQQAVDICSAFPREKSSEAVECLCKKAWDRWMQEELGRVVDDITALIIWF
mmetsp:Transcript_79010/g.180755  ORF Transcript_79010/g.180755 Transcript_79010/m.180755 type:complete len:411 (-) Transcript_79010:221-1453(-)